MSACASHLWAHGDRDGIGKFVNTDEEWRPGFLCVADVFSVPSRSRGEEYEFEQTGLSDTWRHT